MKFLLLIYDLVLTLINVIAVVSSSFNAKHRKWVLGQQGIFKEIKNKLKDNDKEIIWIHCSSLGEFEQGRTIIEQLKSTFPNYKIFLTFFSPSGYEIRKNYEFADYVSYMPLDGRLWSRKFIRLVNPKIAIFVKYEFWYYYYYYLHKKKIPLYLISAIFKREQIFFRFYGWFFKKMLGRISHFFVQDEVSHTILHSFGFKNVDIIPDTRIDRVYQIAHVAREKNFDLIDHFKEDKLLLIAGSSYSKEEHFIHHIMHSGIYNGKVIIAPHQIDKKHISEIMSVFKEHAILWSEANEVDPKTLFNFDVLVIDTIGILSYLYKYGDIALIGGGFGKSIHNLLEPATFGLPIIMGPKNYERFKEAVDLVNLKGAFLIHSYADFEESITYLMNQQKRMAASYVNRNYIHENTGGTERFIKFLKPVLEKDN
jgi:3-deoxy-D-manno-octulosonic-acid transferase